MTSGNNNSVANFAQLAAGWGAVEYTDYISAEG